MEEIQRLAKILKEKKYILAFTGAGISTESGIPDFRSKGEGLWEKIDPEMLSVRNLQRNPTVFYRYFDVLAQSVQGKQPNAGHIALAQLERMGMIKAVVTQNIDGLHQKAGSKRVFEVHGKLTTCHCSQCGHEYPYEDLQQARKKHNEPISPCCGAKLRPSVVLFGDPLGEDFAGAQREAAKADFVLAIGTSLTVYPAAQIPQIVGDFAILNREKTAMDSSARMVIHGSIGQLLTELLNDLQSGRE